MKYFAGIGSRDVPEETFDVIFDIAHMLYDSTSLGLRSGGATGCDSAFELPYFDRKQIFLPWKNFNRNVSPRWEIPLEAYDVGSSVYIHDWSNIKQSVKHLMARNTQQVLGPTLTPGDESVFVICWTKDGCERHEDRTASTGGTGQAISVATTFDVPVINIANKGWKNKLTQVLEEIES